MSMDVSSFYHRIEDMAFDVIDIIGAIAVIVFAVIMLPNVIGLAFSSADPARSIIARAVVLGSEFNFVTSAQYAEDILILANKTGEMEENGTLPAPAGTAKYVKNAYVYYRCPPQYDIYDELSICVKFPLPAPSCIYSQYNNSYFFLYTKVEKPQRKKLLWVIDIGYGG